LQLGCDESCLGYATSKNRLHNLKTVGRAGKINVVVKRGTYLPVYSNYRTNECNLQRVPNTDKKCIKLERIHKYVCDHYLVKQLQRERYCDQHLFVIPLALLRNTSRFPEIKTC